jgi:hypothetical protein
VIDVGNDGDVTDVVLLVHQATDLQGTGTQAACQQPCTATQSRRIPAPCSPPAPTSSIVNFTCRAGGRVTRHTVSTGSNNT